MKRREFLALTGSGGVGLAGCSGTPRASGDTPTVTTSGPAASLGSYGCPPSAPDRTEVVCSHTVDTDEAPVYLLPNERSVSDPASLELTIHNDSPSELAFNPHSWTVRHELETGWGRLERRSQGDGRLVVGGGETHTWTFEEVVDTIDAEAGTESGTYTAEISVPHPTGSDWLDCVALFRIE